MPETELSDAARCFDVDGPAEHWHSRLRDLVWSKAAWPAIADSMTEHGDEVIWQLNSEKEAITLEIVLRLIDAAQRILQEEYDFVMACHGCRPLSLEPYRQHGLLPTDTAWLIEQARDLFPGIADFDERVQRRFTESDLARRRGRVGLLYSRRMALQMPSVYAREGSEFLHSIANCLGNEAKQIWAETGIPTLIQCKIPVEWLNPPISVEPVLKSYAAEAVKTLILMKTDRDLQREVDGGFHLIRTVPPELLTEFIDLREHRERNRP